MFGNFLTKVDEDPPYIKKAKDKGLFKGRPDEKFKSITEIESYYKFKFPQFSSYIKSSFIIDIFNSDINEYSPNNVNHCIIILYRYLYTHLNYLDFINEMEKIENKVIDIQGTYLYLENDIHIIKIKIKYLKCISDIDNMIVYCEKGYNMHKDLECLEELINYHKIRDTNKYLKLLTGQFILQKSSFFTIYSQTFNFKNDIHNFNILVKGIKADEEECFRVLLNDYGENAEFLQKVFLEIGDYSNKTIKLNLEILMNRIRKVNPNYFDNLIKSKEQLNGIFNNNSGYWSGIITGVIGTIIFISIFRR